MVGGGQGVGVQGLIVFLYFLNLIFEILSEIHGFLNSCHNYTHNVHFFRIFDFYTQASFV